MNTSARNTPIAVGHASRHPLMRVRDALTNMAAWLLARQRRALLHDRDRWLGEAVDHADLERRMRWLERCGWRPPC